MARFDLDELSLRLAEEKGLDVPADNPHIVKICESLGLIPELRNGIKSICYTTQAGKQAFYYEVPFEGLCGRQGNFWTPKLGGPDGEGKPIEKELKAKLLASLTAFRMHLTELEALLDEPLPEWVEAEEE